MSIDGAEEDDVFAGAEFLSREEVLRRRSRRLKQLNRCYRKHYWALMEEIRVKHRDYYWEFGKSPVEEDNAATAPGAGTGEAGLGQAEGENGSSSKGERKRCACAGCKSKAMPLTNYCHPHILFDTNQTLYKACNHVIKSTNNVPQICAKPVLRAASPSLCPAHFQRAQRQVSQALKKAGLNVYSYNKPFPKLSVLISECVRQIQAKRRRKRLKLNISVNEGLSAPDPFNNSYICSRFEEAAIRPVQWLTSI
ncbi:INO80 complex subunit D-like [Phalaenopsis equestris]|uniref:INO80 complex subunit D-like n=1 Tax=Phalaenopsis equestris TaxID=78828 RepID=UPI0009E4A04B|nr:INO80 complex subunit D-like [Phalaenopsis equestris]